jgi:hypothetical protein
MGFAMQFVEIADSIVSSGAGSAAFVNPVCSDWSSYASANTFVQADSGV